MYNLSDIINPHYLQKDVLAHLRTQLAPEKTQWEIRHILLDDFLRDDVFEKLKTIFQKEKYSIIDHRDDSHCSNRTLYIEWDFYADIFEFFQSTAFIKYLQILYVSPFERHSVITRERFRDEMGFESRWGIAQMYEKWDYTQWHTDINKDLVREQKVAEWGIKKWHEYEVDDFEEVGAFVYYIYNTDNENWNESYGGNFETAIYNPETEELERDALILPKNNRLIMFRSSNISYHRVSPILKDEHRISIQDLLINYHRN